MHHMVGAFQILDVRKGERPQAGRRRHRDDGAVLRLGGAVQQGGELFGPEGDLQILHRIHPERLVGVGGRVSQKGQRCPHPALPQLCRRLQTCRRVCRCQLDEVQFEPAARILFPEQCPRVLQLFHDAGVGPAGIIFKAVPLHPPPQHRIRAADRNVKDHFFNSFLLPGLPGACILRRTGV